MTAVTRPRGAALITVMLIVAVVAVVAVEMTRRGSVSIGRTGLSVNGQQTQEFALGLEAWARHLLREDALSGNRLDHRGESWAVPLTALPVEGGNVSGRIEDLSGRFNLNDLVARPGDSDQQVAQSRRRFEALLGYLGLRVEIAQAVVDWLDADSRAELRGAEDGAYLSQTPPYRTANRSMTHPTELRLVAGIDAEAWRLLAPHVSALPARVSTNVNAATAPVLASLDESIDLERAMTLVGDGRARWRGREDFLRAAQVRELPAGVDFVSQFFVANVSVALGDGRFGYFSLIERDPDSGATRVLQRGRGSYQSQPLPSPPP